MANPWLPALLLVCLSMAPSVQAEEDFTPQLNTRLVDTGVKLEWTTPEGPRGQNVQAAEVWRYVRVAPEAPGQWQLLMERDGKAPYFVDEAGDADSFYFVRLVFLDGEKSSPSNPSSVNYPHCGWLLLSVPPVFSPHCLFPPPFIEDEVPA